MRIVTWNCAGAFRKKAGQLARFEPHLVVIQECERPEKLAFAADFQPESACWFGDAGARKGVGVFGLGGVRAEAALDVYDPSIRHCIPLRVSGPGDNFNLVAVWAMPQKGDRGASYVGQVCLALERYHTFIQERDTLLLGDLNSNAIFDRPRRECNHTGVVERLEQAGMVSLYHEYFHETHGQETHPTFYLTKKAARPFHLDYCFAPRAWSERVTAFSVGEFEEWRPWSDHVPLFVEFM